MATWAGLTSYATKNQLVSSISGLYADIQDISGLNFQNIEVSTLTAYQWISAPVLYVSDIQGATLDISGISITEKGVFNAPIVTLSSLAFKGFDSLLDLDVSFDLGLGQAIGGLLGGLGALVGGGLIAVGTGAGLAIKGAEEGIATMVAGRPTNYINSNVYEQLNFQTQLQVSTLGNLYPQYSTILRLVSSSVSDQIPGQEIFVSTFFNPGTTCIRSMSDPFHLITADSNINTSTIQSFGQWVPLPEQVSLISSFPDVTLSNITNQSLIDMERTPINNLQKPMINGLQYQISSNNIPFPIGSQPYLNFSNTSQVLYHRDEYQLTNSYVSTNYVRFQSTIGIAAPDPYFITSNISEPCEFTWNGTIGFPGGDFAICDPDQTGFRSTATMDFVVNNTNLLIQWGLAVNNHNSTIAAGTAKRVSWDISANTSNFIDIPPAVSTVQGEFTQQIFGIETNPYEIRIRTLGTAMAPSMMAFDVSGMMFGSNTALSNYNNYPYQFNSSVYVNGTLEAQNIIALSTIFATSTFVDTQISSSTIEANLTDFVKNFTKETYASTLKSSANWGNDYIHSLSRHRFAGYTTPISIVTGNNTSIYDESSRFDFNTSQLGENFQIFSQPTGKQVALFKQDGVEIENLACSNLTTGTIVYSNATAPYITTSTIEFGYTLDYNTPQIPPNYTLTMSISTPAGTAWTDYAAASNQVINIMAFSNQVQMLAQQFSTPLTYTNTSFDGTNRQGWASTIFFNNQTTPARVYLRPNAGNGELSLQAQTFNIVAFPNQSQEDAPANPVPVPVGNTYKFTSDGTTWTTALTPPTPGFVQYQNEIRTSLDFENFTMSTTDTFNINAEKINLNGTVAIPNLQLSNILVDGYVSSSVVRASSSNGFVTNSVYTGSLNGAGVANVLNLQNTVNSTDFLIGRTLLIPSRGYNAFNGFNVNEWNNAVYLCDTNTAAGPPVVILGNLLQLTGFPTYSGQFWINNTYDSPALNVPIYLNTEGVLSVLGYATAGQYTRISTANGNTWTINNNVPNPQGVTNTTYTNYYSVQLTPDATQINSGQPLIYYNPSLIYYNNKTSFYSPQIRVFTIDAPTFNTREAGFEAVSYFDESVVFSGGPETWESDAFNPIINYTGNSYYSLAGWQCHASINRIRTNNDIPIGWELTATAYPVGGGAIDYVWGTARYIQVRTIGLPGASIREEYLMIPKNYYNFNWPGQVAPP